MCRGRSALPAVAGYGVAAEGTTRHSGLPRAWEWVGMMECFSVLSPLPIIIGGKGSVLWLGRANPRGSPTFYVLFWGSLAPVPDEGVKDPQALSQALGSWRTITRARHEPSEHRHQDVGLEQCQSAAVRRLSVLLFFISTTANSSAE